MAFKNQKYVVSQHGDIPAWLSEEIARGRVKVKRDEDHLLQEIVLYTPHGTEFARPGDVILYSRAGTAVVHEADARKMGL